MVFLCIASIVWSSIALHGIALHHIAWHCIAFDYLLWYCMVFVMVLHGILLFCMVLHRLHGVVQLIWCAGELPRSASSHFLILSVRCHLSLSLERTIWVSSNNEERNICQKYYSPTWSLTPWDHLKTHEICGFLVLTRRGEPFPWGELCSLVTCTLLEEDSSSFKYVVFQSPSKLSL